MAKEQIRTVKLNNWSVNLEDEWYEEHPEEMMKEAIESIQQTGKGYFVNLVTPAKYGDPNITFIAELTERLQTEGIDVQEIRYIDECGCGGFVTRVFR